MKSRTRACLAAIIAVLVPISRGVSSAAAPGPVETSLLSCAAPVPGVTWVPWTSAGQRQLDLWCASVGPPVMVQSMPRPTDVKKLLVVTWNVKVGAGQVEDFVSTHWTDRDQTGLVLLLEEAYRAHDSVPPTLPLNLKVPSAIRPSPRTADVVTLAQRLHLSVAYVPSMRNGRATAQGDREDRGNAILSSEPLSDVRAITLPFGKQRRIAIAATVSPRGSAIAPLRVVATHFDIGSHRVAQAEALADRVAAMTDLPVIVGGDFNSPSGLRDKAVQAVGRRLQMEACGTGGTFTWPSRFNLLALFNFGRLDYIFSNLGLSDRWSNLDRQCQTIDDWFQSDHRPVMLTMQ